MYFNIPLNIYFPLLSPHLEMDPLIVIQITAEKVINGQLSQIRIAVHNRSRARLQTQQHRRHWNVRLVLCHTMICPDSSAAKVVHNPLEHGISAVAAQVLARLVH